jgi:hypothetical protein
MCFLVVDRHRTHGLDDIKKREIVGSVPVNGLLCTRVSVVACAAPMTRGDPWPSRRAVGSHSSWRPFARGAVQDRSGHHGGRPARSCRTATAPVGPYRHHEGGRLTAHLVRDTPPEPAPAAPAAVCPHEDQVSPLRAGDADDLLRRLAHRHEGAKAVWLGGQ